MSDAWYFDEDYRETSLADSAVQAMARRQFGISLVVAFALLAAAALTAVRASHETSAEMAVPHKVVQVDAPRMEIMRPLLKTGIDG